MRVINNILYMFVPHNKRNFWNSTSGIILIFILALFISLFLIGLIGKLVIVIKGACNSDIPYCRDEQYCLNESLTSCIPFGILAIIFCGISLILIIGAIYGVYLILNLIFKDCIETYNNANDIYETAHLKKNDEIININ